MAGPGSTVTLWVPGPEHLKVL